MSDILPARDTAAILMKIFRLALDRSDTDDYTLHSVHLLRGTDDTMAFPIDAALDAVCGNFEPEHPFGLMYNKADDRLYAFICPEVTNITFLPIDGVLDIFFTVPMSACTSSGKCITRRSDSYPYKVYSIFLLPNEVMHQAMSWTS